MLELCPGHLAHGRPGGQRAGLPLVPTCCRGLPPNQHREGGLAVSRPQSGTLSPDLGTPKDPHREQLWTPVSTRCPLPLPLSSPIFQMPPFLDGQFPNAKSPDIASWARQNMCLSLAQQRFLSTYYVSGTAQRAGWGCGSGKIRPLAQSLWPTNKSLRPCHAAPLTRKKGLERTASPALRLLGHLLRGKLPAPCHKDFLQPRERPCGEECHNDGLPPTARAASHVGSSGHLALVEPSNDCIPG